MSSELSIRSAKKLKGEKKKREKRDFGKSFHVGSGAKVFQAFLARNNFHTTRRTLRGRRREFPHLHSSGCGNRTLIHEVTQPIKCHKDFSSKTMKFKKQGRRKTKLNTRTNTHTEIMSLSKPSGKMLPIYSTDAKGT